MLVLSTVTCSPTDGESISDGEYNDDSDIHTFFIMPSSNIYI